LPDINDLKFVRLITAEAFRAIPRYLFEMVKEIDSDTIDRIYKYGSGIMTIPVVNKQGQLVGSMPSPGVWVAVMHDVVNVIKGFVWMELDVIEQRVFVQACAVDREYQSGDVINRVVDYIKSIPMPDEMKKNIQFATTRPKAFEKMGWTRSNKVLMELSHEVPKSDDKG